MKRLLKLGLLIFLLTILGTTSFATSQPKVIVNGEILKLEEKLIMKDGFIYIYLRDIAQALKFEINSADNKKSVNLKNENMIIGIEANNQWYSRKVKNGKMTTLKFDINSVPRLIGEKLYVPIGNFTIVAGGKVGWDGEKGIYSIMYDDQLNYISNSTTSVYAGTGKKGGQDGALRKSQFNYAQSIYTTKDNVTYVSDSGTLRKISGDTVETLKMQPNNIKIAVLKGLDNAVYALSAKYKDSTKEEQYGIFKIEDNHLKEIHIQNAKEAKVIDFDFASTNILCILKEDITTSQKYIEVIRLDKNTKPTKVEVDVAFSCLAANGDIIYLSSKNGSIYCYDIKANTMSLVAGKDNVHQFKDGIEGLFCQPRKLKYYKGSLYVLDYNVLRKASVSTTGVLGSWQTIAGKVTGIVNPKMSSGASEELLLSTVNPIDFCISNNGLLLTDPTQFKIMLIK